MNKFTTRILIVEDDPQIRNFITHKICGTTVSAAIPQIIISENVPSDKLIFPLF